MGHGNFKPITTGFETLKSKGIDLIQNDTLRRSISELYDFHYYFLTEDIRYALKNRKEIQAEMVYNNIVSTKPGVSAQPKNIQELQEDITFQEMLRTTVLMGEFINDNYVSGIEQIKKVQQQIRHELSQKRE